VTNIKAKDGTASATIADSTGVMTIATLVGTNGATIQGLTVGRGAGAQANNTVVGANALVANTTGNYGIAIGNQALQANTTGQQNSAAGGYTLVANTTGSYNAGFGTNALLANTTGNYNTSVGVGSLAGNTTASNNTAVGYQAGYLNTTGTYNLFLGYQAGYSNSTANANYFFGHTAGYSTTTGGNNVAIGYQTFYGNTTGTQNVAIGQQALTSNTTASNNTAVGYQAAYTNTTGTGVTAVGKDALLLSTGNFNTAIGRSAGSATTSGANNFFGGVNSGGSNTTGSYNTSVGGLDSTNSAVLGLNTSGSNNTAFGSAALYSNTTASNNTAVGYQAGYTGTTGAQNTFIGRKAGYTANGSYNTAIGDSAGTLLTTGTANTFVGCGASNSAGADITTGSKNTIIGAYGGNSGGLDIRTASNNVVISDGDGELRLVYYNAAPMTKITGTLTQNFTNTQNKSQIQLYEGTNGNLEIASGYSSSDFVVGTGGATGNIAYGANSGTYLSVATGTMAIVGTTFTIGSNTYTVTNASSEGYVYCTPNAAGEAASGTLTGLKYATEGFRVYDNRTAQFKSTVGVGGTAGSTSGAGITFPATQSASSNANTLDDYEEGTWTARLQSSGGGTVTLTSSARYSKVGNLVFVAVESFSISTTGLSAGDLSITGLPFTCNTNNPAIAYFDIAGAVTASVGSVLVYAPNTTTMSVYKSESTSAGIALLQKADLNSNVSIRFNGTYTV
jgi:hypothetical protein